MTVNDLIKELQKFDPNLPTAITVPSDYVATHMEEITSVKESRIYKWHNLRNAPPCVHITVNNKNTTADEVIDYGR